jgi:hypothetical protein
MARKARAHPRGHSLSFCLFDSEQGGTNVNNRTVLGGLQSTLFHKLAGFLDWLSACCWFPGTESQEWLSIVGGGRVS